MDSHKTGRVIADRRAELALTQKQLAQRLHISDRTVSRWERGVGFPDLSLLEPLADALELSVVELLRGERIAPAEQLDPESEHSVRESFRALGRRLKRFQRLLIVLGILLAVFAAGLVWLVANPIRSSLVSEKPITAAQAVDICPDVLITTGEYGLLEELLEREEVRSAFSEDANIVLEQSFSDLYRDRVRVDGEAPDHVQISVIGCSLYVEYGTDRARRTLVAQTSAGRVMKYVAGYSGEPRTETGLDANGEERTIFLGRDVDYAVLNRDNAEFSQVVDVRDLLAPFRGY